MGLQGIVNLLKLWLQCSIEPSFLEQRCDLGRQLEVGIQIKVDVSVRVHPIKNNTYLSLIPRILSFVYSPSDWLLWWIRVGGNQDLLTHCFPMRTHHDNPLNTLTERLPTDFLPVSGCGGTVLKHGGAAMTEEKDREFRCGELVRPR